MKWNVRSNSKRAWRVMVGVSLALGLGPIVNENALAQVSVSKDSGTDRLKKMVTLAKAVTVAELDGRKRTFVGPIPNPVFRYDDPARGFEDGTIWAFGDKGRPLALMKVEFHQEAPHPSAVVYGVASLASETITVKGEDGWRWASTKPGLAMTAIPDAPVPADSETRRLIQMRALTRRFAAAEDDGPVFGKLTLRLLPKPLCRYEEQASGIQDGAIFSLANGTNPDILIAIEATRPAGTTGAGAYRYGIARIGGSTLSVTLDGRTVWTQPRAPIPTTLPAYTNRIVHYE